MPKGGRHSFGFIEGKTSRSDKPAKANEVQRPLAQRGDMSPLKREPNVFIAMPCYGEIPLEVVLAIMRVGGLPFSHAIHLTPGDSLVSRARNRLAADFLESDCTHLLFIDSDIVFEPEDIIRLLENGPLEVGLRENSML
jgi:hypothetical protein